MCGRAARVGPSSLYFVEQAGARCTARASAPPARRRAVCRRARAPPGAPRRLSGSFLCCRRRPLSVLSASERSSARLALHRSLLPPAACASSCHPCGVAPVPALPSRGCVPPCCAALHARALCAHTRTTFRCPSLITSSSCRLSTSPVLYSTCAAGGSERQPPSNGLQRGAGSCQRPERRIGTRLGAAAARVERQDLGAVPQPVVRPVQLRRGVASVVGCTGWQPHGSARDGHPAGGARGGAACRRGGRRLRRLPGAPRTSMVAPCSCVRLSFGDRMRPGLGFS